LASQLPGYLRHESGAGFVAGQEETDSRLSTGINQEDDLASW
jgi:hypothetical protein